MENIPLIIVGIIVVIVVILATNNVKKNTSGQKLTQTGTHASITCVSNCGPTPANYNCGTSGVICDGKNWICKECETGYEGDPKLGCPCWMDNGSPAAHSADLCSSTTPTIFTCNSSTAKYDPKIATDCAEITTYLTKYNTSLEFACAQKMPCGDTGHITCTNVS